MVTIAFLGLGAMGGRMARRFVDEGHDVVVWNRTPRRAEPLTDAGARAASTPAEATTDAELICTMVADPAALREVSEGAGGFADAVSTSATVVEMSTVGPDAIRRLADAVPDGVGVLEGPVLGSLSEADAGTLTVFAGGPAALVERWTPVLSALGSVLHVGALGAGAAAKLVANSTLFGVLGVLGEAVTLADRLGLQRETAFELLAKTPIGQQVERRRSMIETGDAPVRFELALARKDADLIQQNAQASGVDLRLAAAARSWLIDAQHAGRGEEDYSAVLAHILGHDQPEHG